MRRVGPILVATALLAAAGCGGGHATTAATVATTPVERALIIPIEVGKDGVEGGPLTIQVDRGRPVQLLVTAHVTGTVHVHGYDIERKVTAEDTEKIGFVANIVGKFEIEFHGLDLQIAELEVRPGAAG